MPDDYNPGIGEKLGLIGLFRQLPAQISRLIRDELRAAQVELVEKLKGAGIGAGLVLGGAIVALYALGVLITTAILGLATVLAPWLAALIVGVMLLVVAGVLVLLGRNKLKTAVPPLPTESIDSVKEDIRTLKGENR
ncbi:putative superfamily III holin-X [Glaciihabitans tibetensis]|uniref:Putative superfamily III holin-X n=1 Tax=Glaciihabitans tibetensis TaxID=1266600 RepID=A0A2T0VII4_9MICO|nr:phage holin family protein [Glaciihabitans tibetensis]PRY70041.1 putative superfamily III holin-X [Glaciihabitans tibetensis]